MSKIKLLLISVGAILLLWIASWFKLFGIVGSSQNNPSVSRVVLPTQDVSQNISVSIIFDDGKTVDFATDTENLSAFDILKEAADSKNLKLETKKYDFGIFISSIDNYASGAPKSWIYFVNGKAGTIAADQYKLSPGDKVEWKYIAPSGE